MNWNIVEGQWRQFKGKMKEHWKKLTDSELIVIEGRRDKLVGKLQELYGYSKGEAERSVNDFLAKQDIEKAA